MKRSITVRKEIFIHAERQTVWHFTQNVKNRIAWDQSVLSAEYLQLKPFKIIRLRMVGYIVTDLYYKLCRTFEKTSLKMVNTKSLLIKGGGGAWKYESFNGGTKWTQVNTIIFRNSLIYFLVGAIIKSQLASNTQMSMNNVKSILEKQSLSGF